MACLLTLLAVWAFLGILVGKYVFGGKFPSRRQCSPASPNTSERAESIAPESVLAHRSATARRAASKERNERLGLVRLDDDANDTPHREGFHQLHGRCLGTGSDDHAHEGPADMLGREDGLSVEA